MWLTIDVKVKHKYGENSLLQVKTIGTKSPLNSGFIASNIKILPFYFTVGYANVLGFESSFSRFSNLIVYPCFTCLSTNF